MYNGEHGVVGFVGERGERESEREREREIDNRLRALGACRQTRQGFLVLR